MTSRDVTPHILERSYRLREKWVGLLIETGMAYTPIDEVQVQRCGCHGNVNLCEKNRAYWEPAVLLEEASKSAERQNELLSDGALLLLLGFKIEDIL